MKLTKEGFRDPRGLRCAWVFEAVYGGILDGGIGPQLIVIKKIAMGQFQWIEKLTSIGCIFLRDGRGEQDKRYFVPWPPLKTLLDSLTRHHQDERASRGCGAIASIKVKGQNSRPAIISLRSNWRS